MTEDPALHAYFAGFGERINALARAHGVNVDLPNLNSRVTAELLGLAGVVAHSAERKYAPLASFLAGFAVGSLSSAGQLKTDDEVAAFIAQVRTRLGD
jgi:hypothetical protein